MKYEKDFSIIIPHRDSLRFLPKLFKSIPENERIEVLLIDNSIVPITKRQIQELGVTREFKLLYSAPERGAGGARNVGIEHAMGRWLLFLDADDYFSDNAFETFYRYIDTSAEVVYFCMGGIYEDTQKRSDRGDRFTKAVKGFLSGEIDEITLRLGHSSPVAKMVSHTLVDKNGFRFDEVLASNDVYFAMLIGYYANEIKADLAEVYIATVSRGSLTKRRDLPVIMSRYQVALKYNNFLKQHNLGEHQKSVMIYFFYAKSYGPRVLWNMLMLAFSYKQNLFIGYNRWLKSLLKVKFNELRESKYITK